MSTSRHSKDLVTRIVEPRTLASITSILESAMNRLGGLSRALLVRKTTSAHVKSMSTDIAKTDIPQTVVKMRTAGKTDAGRVDLHPADLWLYEAWCGLSKKLFI